MTDKPTLPVVYSCSGASSAAQMANHMAVALDRRGVAEMSCIAGVGGDVPSLVRVATDAAGSGRPVSPEHEVAHLFPAFHRGDQIRRLARIRHLSHR